MEVLLIRDVSSSLIEFPLLWLSVKQNGNDDTVNSDSFTENNPKKLFVNKSTYDMRFYEVILGVLIDEPMILLPEIRIPLRYNG